MISPLNSSLIHKGTLLTSQKIITINSSISLISKTKAVLKEDQACAITPCLKTKVQFATSKINYRRGTSIQKKTTALTMLT